MAWALSDGLLVLLLYVAVNTGSAASIEPRLMDKAGYITLVVLVSL